MDNQAAEPAMDTPELLRAFQATTAEMQRTFKESCASLRNEFLQHHAQSTEALSNQIKQATSKKWRKEGNRKQFDFNYTVLECLSKACEANKKGDPSDTAKQIDEAIQKITSRQKLIRMADSSEAGWQTVNEYQTNELASGSEDEKRIQRAEARAIKKLKRPRSTRGSSRFRPYTSFFRPFTNQPAQRPFKPKLDSRSGSCFACGSPGHWRRECPLIQPGRSSAPSTAPCVTSAKDARLH